MHRLTCKMDSLMATRHDCCDVITEEDAYPFPTFPHFDCGLKIGCLIDIATNPTIILYQRDTSIYCPIF